MRAVTGAEGDGGVPVGAIPCDPPCGECSVCVGLAEHRARFPDCGSWPLCDCTSRVLEAWIGDERLELPDDEA